MNRYFLEVSYIGTNYAGFQVQENANTVQAELEKALCVLLRKEMQLTGSSRTDSGVHALQNYFHFDSNVALRPDLVYNINAILPGDISVSRLINVSHHSHCRFDAIARRYSYHLYRRKNPFLADRAYYYPYAMNIEKLQEAANVLFEYSDYRAFSKRRTQVKTFECRILEAQWRVVGDETIFFVKGNRFLRGMVRGLVGTMLKVGRGRTSVEEFRKIIEDGEPSRSDFSVPATGLILREVIFPGDYFNDAEPDVGV